MYRYFVLCGPGAVRSGGVPRQFISGRNWARDLERGTRYIPHYGMTSIYGYKPVLCHLQCIVSLSTSPKSPERRHRSNS